jgi:hypothetical protein
VVDAVFGANDLVAQIIISLFRVSAQRPLELALVSRRMRDLVALEQDPLDQLGFRPGTKSIQGELSAALALAPVIINRYPHVVRPCGRGLGCYHLYDINTVLLKMIAQNGGFDALERRLELRAGRSASRKATLCLSEAERQANRDQALAGRRAALDKHFEKKCGAGPFREWAQARAFALSLVGSMVGWDAKAGTVLKPFFQPKVASKTSLLTVTKRVTALEPLVPLVAEYGVAKVRLALSRNRSVALKDAATIAAALPALVASLKAQSVPASRFYAQPMSASAFAPPHAHVAQAVCATCMMNMAAKGCTCGCCGKCCRGPCPRHAR